MHQHMLTRLCHVCWTQNQFWKMDRMEFNVCLWKFLRLQSMATKNSFHTTFDQLLFPIAVLLFDFIDYFFGLMQQVFSFYYNNFFYFWNKFVDLFVSVQNKWHEEDDREVNESNSSLWFKDLFFDYKAPDTLNNLARDFLRTKKRILVKSSTKVCIAWRQTPKKSLPLTLKFTHRYCIITITFCVVRLCLISEIFCKICSASWNHSDDKEAVVTV